MSTFNLINIVIEKTFKVVKLEKTIRTLDKRARKTFNIGHCRFKEFLNLIRNQRHCYSSHDKAKHGRQ